MSFNIAPKALYHEYLEEVKRKLAEANVRKKKAYHGGHREGTEVSEKDEEEKAKNITQRAQRSAENAEKGGKEVERTNVYARDEHRTTSTAFPP